MDPNGTIYHFFTLQKVDLHPCKLVPQEKDRFPVENLAILITNFSIYYLLGSRNSINFLEILFLIISKKTYYCNNIFAFLRWGYWLETYNQKSWVSLTFFEKILFKEIKKAIWPSNKISQKITLKPLKTFFCSSSSIPEYLV